MTDNSLPNRDDQRRAAKAQDEKARARRERWMVTFTGVIAFVSAVQAFSSYLQWDAMRKALDANERAWVIPRGPSILKLEPNQPIVLESALANFGKSPAFDVVLRWHTLFNLSPPPPESKRQGGESRAPMVPGQIFPVKIHLPPMSTSDTADIKAGTKMFFLVGDVIYSDPFAASDRFTRVCFKYVPQSENWSDCDLQTYR